MKKPKEALLLLNEKTDLLAVELVCPIDGERYIHGVPYAQVPCGKCGSTYRTDFNQDIYTKKARQFNAMLANNDIVKIEATERYEAAISHIKEHFTKMNNWEVSEIKQGTDEYKFCMKCGICQSCFTCNSCGKIFSKDTHKRRQKCPECNSDRLTKTYIQEVKLKKDVRLCPHCDSGNIRMTWTKNKSKCQKCGSRKLSGKKTNLIYTLTIKRKKAYRIED